jgi:hypothetical protein
VACCEALLVEGRSAAATWARAVASEVCERFTWALETLTEPDWDWLTFAGAWIDSICRSAAIAVLLVCRWTIWFDCRAAVAWGLAD